MRSAKSETIPAWAMKLIADAQTPNPRWLRFNSRAFMPYIEWVFRTAARVTVAREIMRVWPETEKLLDDPAGGDNTALHG